MTNSLASRIGNSFAVLSGVGRRQKRDAYEELRKFDEFMLKDIGLTRQDVLALRRGR